MRACVQGPPKPLGRAFAEPEFKTVEQFYEKPRLRFYDIIRGRVPAGELLAAFELIELDYSGFGEVTSIGLYRLCLLFKYLSVLVYVNFRFAFSLSRKLME